MLRLVDGIETALISQAVPVTMFIDETKRLNSDYPAQS
jgi:hypothetical protein